MSEENKNIDKELDIVNAGRGSAISPTGMDCFTTRGSTFGGNPQCNRAGFHCVYYNKCKNPEKAKNK